MSTSPAFDAACGALEQASSFDRLESRGTIRLALQSAGLDAASVTPDQLRVVVDRLLPDELSRRGVADDTEAILEALRAALEGAARPTQAVDSPEAVFERLGRLERAEREAG